MTWVTLSGSLWMLYRGEDKVATVSLMCGTGGYTGCLYPPRPGANLGMFRTESDAKMACEMSVMLADLIPEGAIQ